VVAAGRSTLAPTTAGDLVVALAFGIVIGGRLGYVVFYQPALLWTFGGTFPFWDLLAVNKGGMASHGGMIGLIVASWWYARRYGHNMAHLLDLGAFGAPLGLFFGRIANFVNGELYGRGPTDVPWAVKFPQEIFTWDANRLTQLEPVLDMVAAPTYDQKLQQVIVAIQNGNQQIAAAIEPLLTPRHPSQIYEALLEGLLLFAVLGVVWLKPRKPMTIGALACVVYGLVRIFGELYRQPDEHIGYEWLDLPRGQWLSIALTALGIVLLVIFNRKQADPMGGWRRHASSMHGSTQV